MDDLTKLSQDPRVTRRRPEPPDPGGACVWYWIERAQRGIDNAALDVVVDAANALRKPVVVFLARVPYYPNANLHHCHLLAEGGQIRTCRARARAGKFDSKNYIEQNLTSKLFYAQLPFANGGNSGQRTGGKLVLPPIVQNARRQGVCAHNPYVRSGFHTLLHPHAFQIGKFQFDAKLLEPPRRCLSDLSRDLANQK
jgi:hypothetical protein